MNAIDLIAIVIFIITLIIYAARGFLRSIGGAIRVIISFVISKIFSDELGALISERFLTPRSCECIKEHLLDALGEDIGNLNLATVFSENGELVQLLRRFGMSHLYDVLKAEYAGSLFTSEETVAELIDRIALPWSERLSVVLGGIIVFLASFFVLGLLIRCVTACVEHTGFLGAMDHLLGLLLGAVSGVYSVVVFCFILFFCINALLFMGRSPELLLDLIENSKYLGRIYLFVTGAS